MADTKMEEAIALARRIVADGWNPDDLPLYPHEKAAVLARALIDTTSPGAQFRAGIEAAAEVIHKRIEADRAVHCGIIARTTLDRDAAISGAHIEAIRAPIAALTASPEPAPVAMPALRWEEDITGSAYCLLGEFLVGNVVWVNESKYEARVPDRDGKWIRLALRATKPEARTAVEAAVRERLTTIPAKGADHG